METQRNETQINEQDGGLFVTSQDELAKTSWELLLNNGKRK